MPTDAPAHGEDPITTITRLLHHAATRAWEQAEQEGPRSTGHLLGLGIELAAAQAGELLAPGTDSDSPVPSERDVPALLRRALQIAQAVPAGAAPAGFADVATAVAHLASEVGP